MYLNTRYVLTSCAYTVKSPYGARPKYNAHPPCMRLGTVCLTVRVLRIWWSISLTLLGFLGVLGTPLMHWLPVTPSVSVISCRLDTFLPREYAKGRGVNEKVIAEFQKLTGLTDLNAKLRYVRLFRSLKTYGVSFFHVKVRIQLAWSCKDLNSPPPFLCNRTTYFDDSFLALIEDMSVW